MCVAIMRVGCRENVYTRTRSQWVSVQYFQMKFYSEIASYKYAMPFIQPTVRGCRKLISDNH